MKRNISILFIFAIVFVLIGEAQSARYGGPPASYKTPVSVAPAAPKSVNFSSSKTGTSSLTISQPKGNNSLINNYKAQAAQSQRISLDSRNATVNTSSVVNNTTVPKQPVVDGTRVYTAPAVPNVIVVQKQPTKVVEVHHYDNSNSALNTMATWSMMDSMLNRDRNSSEYREWRYRAEREAAENAELRAKLSEFDNRANYNTNAVETNNTVDKPDVVSSSSAKFHSNNKPQTQTPSNSSGWGVLGFIIGLGVLAFGVFYLVQTFSSKKGV